jgi:hypothetical protein
LFISSDTSSCLRIESMNHSMRYRYTRHYYSLTNIDRHEHGHSTFDGHYRYRTCSSPVMSYRRTTARRQRKHRSVSSLVNTCSRRQSNAQSFVMSTSLVDLEQCQRRQSTNRSPLNERSNSYDASAENTDDELDLAVPSLHNFASHACTHVIGCADQCCTTTTGYSSEFDVSGSGRPLSTCYCVDHWTRLIRHGLVRSND